MRALVLFIATAAYSGYVPTAPGTTGSVVGLVLVVLVRSIGHPFSEAVLVTVVLTAGVWAASSAERLLQRRDPGIVVIDEVVGMLIALLWVPVSWIGGLVGLIAFRGFDIAKPFPIRSVERLPHGWGVVADDVVAGIYANVCVRMLAWVVPSLLMS